MRTELWAAKVDRELSEEETRRMTELLPPQRRERLERMRDSAARREALCAWTLLRMALWEALGWESLPEVEVTELGKPNFVGYSDVQFSISHTSGAVLVGISNLPIGVDVERIRAVSPRVMRRVGGVDTPEEFFRRWVALEAKGKRSGWGVLSMLDEGRRLWGSDSYQPLRIFPGYVAGAAVSPGCTVPEVRVFTI
ncbi:MAG: 4'-phosphopantetheinyl transferase [Oscillibacter sp.]|nr:4'-phosphopantetheinyl transferase [Oscillibacter sp.]